MKNKDICDYDPRCIISSGLMVDDIIMDHIKKSNHHISLLNNMIVCFTQIDTDMIYIHRGSLQYFYWKRGTYEFIDIPCEYYTIKRNEVKGY